MAEITLGDTPEIGQPTSIFEFPYEGGSNNYVYDVTRDGLRFLIDVRTQGVAVRPITLVSNWTEMLPN